MEFLKSLVPGSMSGESPGDHGGVLPRDSGPRLLRMKRLSLLSMGQTIEEEGQTIEEDGGIRGPGAQHASKVELQGNDLCYV
ncbi:Phospho-N-acetylmuramoyl-pentapeptide-transferase [Dissostichus eleginoides]|uniref:Phospho-N-acetylmuramoyl-pentapeptide-transferase n=1 Tax=Dissostichus eleginoides TaxID=100907 RepID=A0AAD9F7Z7_DISEL|nr:Phospho-N-acetylmuramoyl-pentapeptide-transferase [Dissostichus eleginoides]